MKSWSDLKRDYERGVHTATQSTEDMAARRILRCLGLTEKSLGRHERERGLNVNCDQTLYERACAAAYDAVRTRLVLPPVRDVRSVKEAEETLLELCETLTFHPNGGFCALVYRVRGTQDLRALASKGATDVLYVPELPFPCGLRKSRDGQAVLVDCDAGDYYGTILGTKDERK